MTNQKDNRSPYAEAMEWVSRIAAVAMVMVLPGLAGQWLDGRLGTKFMALVGFALGVTGGIACLLAMTGSARRRGPPGGSNRAGGSNEAGRSEAPGKSEVAGSEENRVE